MLHGQQTRNGQPLFATVQHPAHGVDGAEYLLFRQQRDGNVAQGIHENEPVITLGVPQPVQNRLEIVGRFLGGAVGEQVFRDDFYGVGNPDGVLGRDFVVRMETVLQIRFPQVHRFRQKGQQSGGHGFMGGVGRQLLAVPGAAVGQNPAHKLGGPAAHVALLVHQKLIEKTQNPALVGAGHVGVILGKQMEICPNAVETFFAAGRFQQLFKGCIHGDGVHQRHVVGKGQVPQCVHRLRQTPQGRVFPGQRRLQRRGVRVDATGVKKLLKIPQLAVYRPVAPLFGLGHIGQLGENHVVGIGQRVDAYHFLAVFPRAADPKIGVNENQRFQGQILKFQVPGGMVGGCVGNGGAVVLCQPLVGEVIVEIGNPPGIGTPAAEFASVMAQRRSADQCHIHRKPCGGGLPGRGQCHMVDADGMGCRVKGHHFSSNAHQQGEAGGADCVEKPSIFLLDPAGAQLLMGQQGDIGQRVIGAAGPLLEQQPVQNGAVEPGGLLLGPGVGGAVGVGEKPVAQIAVKPQKPAALRFRRQSVQNGAAQLQYIGTGYAATGVVFFQRLGKSGSPGQRPEGLLGQGGFGSVGVVKQFQQGLPLGEDRCGHG